LPAASKRIYPYTTLHDTRLIEPQISATILPAVNDFAVSRATAAADLDQAQDVEKCRKTLKRCILVILVA
jgi:hypothetical protein